MGFLEWFTDLVDDVSEEDRRRRDRYRIRPGQISTLGRPDRSPGVLGRPMSPWRSKVVTTLGGSRTRMPNSP